MWAIKHTVSSAGFAGNVYVIKHAYYKCKQEESGVKYMFINGAVLVQ